VINAVAISTNSRVISGESRVLGARAKAYRCAHPLPSNVFAGAHEARKQNAQWSNYCLNKVKKGKGSPYSITERSVPELIPVLGSRPAGDVSHKPDGRLSLLSARHAVTPATLKKAAASFAAW